MPRIRTIKPEFFGDEKLALLQREIRLLFVGLWVFGDDYGTVRSNPIWIKSNIFPYDQDLEIDDIKEWLSDLVSKFMIIPFNYNGEGFYHIRTFNEHQRVDKKSKPIIPLDKKAGIVEKLLKELISRGVFDEYSKTEVGSSTEELVNGKEKEIGEGGADAPTPTGILDDKQAKMLERQKVFYNELKAELESYSKEMLRAFFNYWSEPNKSKTKMKFEMELTWDLKRRLVTWEKNEQKFSKNGNKVPNPQVGHRPKTFGKDLRYLIERYQEGELKEESIDAAGWRYNYTLIEPFVAAGFFQKFKSSVESDQKKMAVIEFIKEQAVKLQS